MRFLSATTVPRPVGGKEFLVETPIRADFALIAAHRSDDGDNLEYSLTARNFNMIMATAADTVIVEPDTAKEIAAKAGVTFNSVLPGENVLMSLSEVASGLGFCLLPDNVRQIHPPNVVARPLDCDPEPEFSLLVAYRKDDRLPAVGFFLSLLREQLSQEAPSVAAAKPRP